MKKKYKNATDALQDILGNIGGIVYSNKTGTYPLDQNRNVEISISSETHKHWNKVRVKIISKFQGEIASTQFVFKDYIEEEIPHPNGIKTEHLWEHDNATSWYGNSPSLSSVKKLRDSIFDWVKIWE